MFENGVLRNIVGPKKDEVTAEGKGVPNEQLCHLHCSLNIIRVIKKNELGVACEAYGGEERCI